ncbi:putative polyribonucleotide nucleotidyltransferase, partial [Trichinella nativa]
LIISVIKCEDAIPVYNVNDGDKIVGRIQTKAHFVNIVMNGQDEIIKVPGNAKVTKDKASPKDEVWVNFMWTVSNISYEWNLNFKLKNENVIFESATLKQNSIAQNFKPMMNFGNWTHAYSCKFVVTAVDLNSPEKLPLMIMQSNKIQVFNFMKNFSEDVTTCQADLSTPDVGHWNLTNDKSEICLRFDGAVKLNVTYKDLKNDTKSVLLNVPSSAYIIPSESYCASTNASVNETTEQRLTLGFYDNWSLGYLFTRDANITGDKRGDHWILHEVTLKRKMMDVLTPNCLNPVLFFFSHYSFSLHIMNPASGRGEDWNNSDAEMLDVHANKETIMASRSQVNNDEGTSVEAFRDFFNMVSVQADVGSVPMILETGQLARLADGSAVAKMGATTVMATVVAKSRSAVQPMMFMPLTVDYRSRAAAVGRIPTNFLRREIGASDSEILTARMIDRSLRPAFGRDCYVDCQVSCSLLSLEADATGADVLAVNAASAALACSNVVWNGPVACARVCWVDSRPVLNPSRQQLEMSTLNLVLSVGEHRRIVMVEAGGGSSGSCSLDQLYACCDLAVDSAQRTLDAIKQLAARAGKPKRVPSGQLLPADKPDDLTGAIQLYASATLGELLLDKDLDKMAFDERVANLRHDTADNLRQADCFQDDQLRFFDVAFNDLLKKALRDQVFNTGHRRDGRTLDELRPIDCSVDLYPSLHGSALFQRGQTQVMCSLTFDSRQAAFRGDMFSLLNSGGITKEKKFMFHYNFASFATNELSSARGIGRRELGHGALAEKALRPVVPSDFPFTIRLAADVLESNGSSSMASVCAGSLALMDAGVPTKSSVSGVAIGLMSKQDENGNISDYRLLTDIAGIEDFFGDMDFKIAFTSNGEVTAIQLDTKLLGGIDQRIFRQACERGLQANRNVQRKMAACLAKPRAAIKPNGPVEEQLPVPASKRSRLLGAGGLNLKRIEARTGVQISQLDDTVYSVFAPNKQAMQQARQSLDQLLADNVEEEQLEFGAIYETKIVELKDAGLMVQLHPSLAPVFVPNSQLDSRRIAHPATLGFQVGQTLLVKYFGRDPVTGQMRLSRKVLQQIGPAGERSNVCKCPKMLTMLYGLIFARSQRSKDHF